MKYWTLFTLRMIARAGLLLTLVLWMIGYRGSKYTTLGTNMASVVIEPTPKRLALFCYEGRGALYHGMPAAFPGDGIQEDETSTLGPIAIGQGVGRVSLRIDHWFLCLTFFIATVVAHWRWKKPQVRESAVLTEDNA